MTPEQFKQTFKVGDLISAKEWDELIAAEKITAIGDTGFLSYGEEGEGLWYFTDKAWVKIEPPTPKKKPSEEIQALLDAQFGMNCLVSPGTKAIMDYLDENVPKWEWK